MHKGQVHQTDDMRLRTVRENLEVYLEARLDSLSDLPPAGAVTIQEMVQYGLGGGGKRIRPVLLLSLVQDLTHTIHPSHLAVAAALEIIHNATLIHDDLPGLDNDDQRRGRATVHRKFGEGEAILIADYMVPLALSVCTEETSLDAESRLKATKILLQAYREVCYGQLLDRHLANAPGKWAEEEMLRVHRFKTAALFRAATELVCVTSPALADHSFELVSMGENFGMFFQAVDDFLDREDEAPNLFSTCALPEALARIDDAWLTLDQQLTRIEALILGTSLCLTREVMEEVRARYLAG